MNSSGLRPSVGTVGRARPSSSPRRWAAVSLAALAASGAVFVAGALPSVAETPAPVAPAPVNPAAPVATQPPAGAPASAPVARTVVVLPPNAAPGATVTVAGAGWPAGAVVVANLCGNSGLNAATDCSPTPAGQSIAAADGGVTIPVIVAAPGQPCPCVVRLSVAGDPTTADGSITIDGATATPPGTTTPGLTTPGLTTPPPVAGVQSSVDVTAKIEGSGPLSAYLGGAAQREVVVSVTNTGTAPLVNPVLVLTFGKGQEPTEPLLGPNGQPPALGTIAPGQSAVYTQPVTIDAPAFGQYRLLGRFDGIATVSVDGSPQTEPTFTATTSSYPWILIVGGWLLLQIPLLGLYKRRPVVVEPADEDPYRDRYAADIPVEAPAGFGAAPAVPAAATVAVAATSAAPAPPVPAAPSAVAPPPPTAQPPAPPLPAGFQLVGAPTAPEPAAPVAAPASPAAGPASQDADPLGDGQRVFGVNDLRSMLDG